MKNLKVRKGSLLIEFIWIFPIMVVMMTGIYALGQYIVIKQKVEEAAFMAAKNVAEPKFSSAQEAMYYPYKPGLGRITAAALIRDFLRRGVNVGPVSVRAWQAIDPREVQNYFGGIPFISDMFFKKGFDEADRNVKRFFQLSGLKTDTAHLKVEFRVNANWATLDSVYLPDPHGNRHIPINDHRGLGSNINRRRGHGVAVEHPPYYDNRLWNQNRLNNRFRSKWLQYRYPFWSWSGATRPDYMHGFDPREFDNKQKYYYSHYNFPAGGWIVVAKVKYKYRVPIAPALADVILRFITTVSPQQRNEFVNLTKEMWLEGTGAYPVPLSVYDIVDADSALHKAQLDPDAWKE